MRHCKEVLTPVLLRGATTRPLKLKSWRLGDRWRWWSRQWRQPPLHWAASPAAATTSATSSPASGGDHLNTDDSGHLCTGGLPATTDASTSAERSSPPSSCESEDKTIQERGRHLHGVRHLVQPLRRCRNSVADSARDATGAADLRTARPSPVRWTDSHAPLGGRRQRWRRHLRHPGQGARHAATDDACSRSALRSRGSPPPQGW
jgi:hypothetical protein